MKLALTATDHRTLAATLEVVVSPLDSSMDEWLMRVCASTKTLMDADCASIVIPDRGIGLSTDRSEACEPYRELREAMDRRFDFFRRALTLGTFCRNMVWPDLDAYYMSPYYNEYIVPHRFFDALSMMVPLAEPASATTAAEFVLHHDHPHGRVFGTAGLTLFAVLRAPLAAALRNHLALVAHRGELARLIDSVADGLVVVDRDGRMLHANSALSRLLAADPEAERLRTEMMHVARSLLGLARSAETRSELTDPQLPVCFQLSTAAASYSIRGNLLGDHVLAPGARALVSLTRTTAEQPRPEVLQARFGLTRRESQVALLLAEGRTNKAIARALTISAYTARHHTEKVMLKLGARTRAEVPARVMA